MASRDDTDMNTLADLVGGGLSLSAAARRMGISTFRREYLWQRIVARLGWQAK